MSSLKELWTRDKDAIKSEEVEMAFDELEASAVTLKSKKRRSVSDKTKALKRALDESQNNGDFATIFQAKLELAKAELEFKTAKELYSEYFDIEESKE